MDADERYRLASLKRAEETRRLDRKIAREKRGFAVHAAVYAVVIPMLWVIFLTAQRGQGVPWPLFPMLGWGFGVMGHAFGARAKIRQLHGERDELLLAPVPQLDLPPAEAETDTTLARAEALLARERAG